MFHVQDFHKITKPPEPVLSNVQQIRKMDIILQFQKMIPFAPICIRCFTSFYILSNLATGGRCPHIHTHTLCSFFDTKGVSCVLILGRGHSLITTKHTTLGLSSSRQASKLALQEIEEASQTEKD